MIIFNRSNKNKAPSLLIYFSSCKRLLTQVQLSPEQDPVFHRFFKLKAFRYFSAFWQNPVLIDLLKLIVHRYSKLMFICRPSNSRISSVDISNAMSPASLVILHTWILYIHVCFNLVYIVFILHCNICLRIFVSYFYSVSYLFFIQ